jgi:hypothetical protein
MADITLNGFDELISSLEGAERAFIPVASKATTISLTAIYEQISPYPPQPDRMRSGHLNRYVRGQGVYPASAFIQDSSQPGGYATKRTKKAQIKLTSQQMDKKWRMNVINTGENLTGLLVNEASYSGYVSGSKEGDQVPFHAETGWPNKEDSIAAAMPIIEESINSAVDAFIAQLGA